MTFPPTPPKRQDYQLDGINYLFQIITFWKVLILIQYLVILLCTWKFTKTTFYINNLGTKLKVCIIK